MEKRREMTLVGAAHDERDFGDRQSRGFKKMLRARHAAPDQVLVRRKPGRLLENVRKMIRVQLQYCGHFDERQSLTEISVNVANKLRHSLCRRNIGFDHEIAPLVRI
jgi:hypothetical protein